MQNVQEVLHYIQKNLLVPKGRKNSFGGYNFRNCEDILDAVKKLLPDGATVIESDEIVLIGNRYYLKAVATLKYKGEKEFCDGYARESESKKGFDESQITGAASSYARKYALSGLFAIDDGIDDDSLPKAPNVPKDERKNNAEKVKEKTPEDSRKAAENFVTEQIALLKACTTLDAIMELQIKTKKAVGKLMTTYPELFEKLEQFSKQRQVELQQ